MFCLNVSQSNRQVTINVITDVVICMPNKTATINEPFMQIGIFARFHGRWCETIKCDACSLNITPIRRRQKTSHDSRDTPMSHLNCDATHNNTKHCRCAERGGGNQTPTDTQVVHNSWTCERCVCGLVLTTPFVHIINLYRSIKIQFMEFVFTPFRIVCCRLSSAPSTQFAIAYPTH